MRWLVVVALVALMSSGCMVAEGDPETQSNADGTTSTTGSSHANHTVSMTLTKSPAPGGSGNATGNATAPGGNATGEGNATVDANAPANQTAGPVVIVFQTSFSGSLPVDGLQATHEFAVPSGAVRVEVTYTSDHIGLFTALAHVDDPTGERINSSDACGFGDTGAAVNTCLMVVDTEVGPGTWAAALTWQVGQATEDYTFDVVVYGIVA